MNGEQPLDDGRCVGCGPLSEIGLRMTCARVGADEVVSELAVPERFAGWRGVAHGGVVALILDEAMAYAAGARGIIGMTGEMKMRFRASVPIGEPLVVRGKVLWERRSVLGIEADIRAQTGRLLASGTGSFVARGTVEPGTRFAQLA